MYRVLYQPACMCKDTSSKKDKERPKILKRIVKVEQKRVERLNKIFEGGKKMSSEDFDQLKSFHKTLVDSFRNDKKSKEATQTDDFESIQKSIEYTPVVDDTTDNEFFEA